MGVDRALKALTAIAAGAGAGLVLAAGAARAETLSDAIALAYQTNPTLQGQRATQRALDENIVQAKAGYRPTLGAQATITTDHNNEGALNPFNLTPGISQTMQAGLQITQPIYTGGLVRSQIHEAISGVDAGREALREVEQEVIDAVIVAYVDVRRDQEGLAIAQENANLLERQLAESKARFEVGEITRTDVAETEARVAGARAQLSTAHAQLAISRANYAAVVGQNPGNLAPEPSLARLLPATVDEAFANAEKGNPQILQADYAERASAAKVAEAKAETRPTISLRGTAGYFGGNIGLNTPFANYTHDVSASAVINVPLFTGGLTFSKVRQAAETNNADRINIETVRRKILLAIAQGWNQLLAARANLVSDEEQVRAANIAFEGTRQEAEVGLRTTLDVLITEQDLSNAQLALAGARHDEYAAAAAVLAAEGQLYAQDLSDVPVYDAKKNTERVQRIIRLPEDGAIGAFDRIASPSEPPAPPELPPASPFSRSQ